MRAISRLYRSRFLQPNLRRKALAEIYTMHSVVRALKSQMFCQKCIKKLRKLMFVTCSICYLYKNVAKFCQMFWVLTKFCTMLKNCALISIIGVDPADILILWWYVDTLALCKLKMKALLRILSTWESAASHAVVRPLRPGEARQHRGQVQLKQLPRVRGLRLVWGLSSF